MSGRRLHPSVQSLRRSLTFPPFPFLIAGLLAATAVHAKIPVQMAVGPDSNHNLLVKTIESAKSNLIINVYQFESPTIAETLIQEIKSGVTVQLLIEGEPVRGMSPEGRATLRELLKAFRAAKNSRSRLYVMTDSGSPITAQKRRFRYNHAKYVTVDGKRALISSENFSKNGHALPGEKGNRGWDIVLDDAKLAKSLAKIFAEDADLSFDDVEQLFPTPKKKSATLALLDAREAQDARLLSETRTFATVDTTSNRRLVRQIGESEAVATANQAILAPDALPALTGMLRKARKNIELEFMSLPSVWRSPSARTSPLLETLIAAARRGVETRVIVNDDTVFAKTEADGAPAKKTANQISAELLAKVARCEKIPLSAKVVNVKKLEITYVHNKGILVDDDQTLVSSINGTQNSMENNREVAVLVDGPDVNAYFKDAFETDWDASTLVRASGRCATAALWDSASAVSAFSGLLEFDAR